MPGEVGPLPRWEMATVLPSPDSPGFRREFEAVVAAIAYLSALFDAHRVERRERVPLDAETVGAVEEVIARYNAVLAPAVRIEGFLACLVAVNSRDGSAQAAASEWRQQEAVLAALAAR